MGNRSQNLLSSSSLYSHPDNHGDNDDTNNNTTDEPPVRLNSREARNNSFIRVYNQCSHSGVWVDYGTIPTIELPTAMRNRCYYNRNSVPIAVVAFFWGSRTTTIHLHRYGVQYLREVGGYTYHRIAASVGRTHATVLHSLSELPHIIKYDYEIGKKCNDLFNQYDLLNKKEHKKTLKELLTDYNILLIENDQLKQKINELTQTIYELADLE